MYKFTVTTKVTTKGKTVEEDYEIVLPNLDALNRFFYRRRKSKFILKDRVESYLQP